MSKTWFRLFVAALALALVAGACGGDDEGDESSDTPEPEQTTEASVDNTAFCNGVIEGEAAVIAASQGDASGDPTAALQEAQANAPEEISSEVTTLVEGSLNALETQDDSIFEDPEFRAADEVVDQYVFDNCELERVDVAAAEYSFTGIPPSIPAGSVGFNVTNEGEELHEMILARFNDPSDTIEELVKLPQKEAEKAITPVGFMFADPGESDIQTFVLEPGTYGAVCFIPVGTTADKDGEGPPHALEGMTAQFTVE